MIKQYIKNFEITVISLILIILILHKSDPSVLDRSFLFNQYSTNFLYFISLYIFFFILFFFDKIKNKIRIIIFTLNSIYLLKIFKNQNLEYLFFKSNLIHIMLIILMLLSFVIVLFYNIEKLKNIKKFSIKKLIINFLNINIKNILKYSFITIVMIITFEIILSFLLPKNFTNLIPNKIYGNYFYNFPYRHEAIPYIGKGMRGNVNLKYTHVTRSGKSYVIDYSTNNKGFRIPFDLEISHNYKKQNNEIVILLIGGSTLFGVGASDSDTISSILQKKLKNKFPKYKFTVLNFGIGAANTYQEFLVLDLYGKNFQPDWVISLTGRNDGHNSLVSNVGAGYPNGFLRTKKLLDGLYFNQPNGRIFYSQLGNFLSKYSAIFRILTGSSHLEKKEKKDIQFDETYKTLDFYLKSINNIINIDKTINYIISNQPYYDLIINNNFKNIDQLTEFEKNNADRSYKDINKMLWTEYWNAKASLETKLFLQKKENIFYIDFNKEFSNLKNLEDIYIDSTHLTKDGNDIIAQKYFKIITKNFTIN